MIFAIVVVLKSRDSPPWLLSPLISVHFFIYLESMMYIYDLREVSCKILLI